MNGYTITDLAVHAECQRMQLVFLLTETVYWISTFICHLRNALLSQMHAFFCIISNLRSEKSIECCIERPGAGILGICPCPALRTCFYLSSFSRVAGSEVVTLLLNVVSCRNIFLNLSVKRNVLALCIKLIHQIIN